MRTVKKIVLLLIAVIPVFLSLPAHVVLAQGTTVEINNGNQITLKVGQSIVASESSGIPISVKNMPDLGAPANGLAGFTFEFSWDPAVIRVDSAFKNNAAGWTLMLPETVNSAADTLRSAGITTTYSTDDVILLYLGVKAVGKVGDSTTINVIITALGDKDANPIAATSVNAPVKISAAKLVSIGITPADQSVSSGSSLQFAAMGNYDDASIVNVTSLAAWTSGNGAIATIQNTGKVNPGLATGLALGKTTLTAALEATSATTTLTVTKAEDKPVSPPSDPKQVTSSPIPASPSTPTQPAGINMWLIVGVGASVIIIGLVLYLLLKMRSGDR